MRTSSPLEQISVHLDRLIVLDNTLFVQGEYQCLQSVKLRLEKLRPLLALTFSEALVALRDFLGDLVEERQEMCKSEQYLFPLPRMYFWQFIDIPYNERWETIGESFCAFEALEFLDVLEDITEIHANSEKTV